MSIEFRCLRCQRLLRTPESAAGQHAKCPECGEVMAIPPVGSTAPAPAAVPPDLTGAEPPAYDSGTVPMADEAEVQPSGIPPLPPPPLPPGAADRGGQAPEEAANPYSSPSAYGPVAVMTPEFARAYALERVAAPAVGLMAAGALGLLSRLGIMGFQGMAALAGRGAPNMLGVVALAAAVLIFVGGWRMKNLENFSLARMAAVLAMIPCISPCCALGIPFGVWALVVLADGNVRAAFRS